MSDAGRPANRPNILFVFPDELRPQALGFMRQDPVLTPNIDRFAAESIVLTHCVSNFPVCTPFRGMFLTGRYPYQTGLISNCNTDTTAHGVFLKESERCLSDVLSAQGYDCGYIGKWHLDAPDPADAAWTEGRRGDGVIWDGYTPPGPRRHGFNFWYSYGCCDRHFDPHYWTGDAPVSGRIDPHLWSVEHETNVAVDYIRNSAGCRRDETKPFCLVISHNPPHMPFAEVPDRYKALYAGRSPAELLNRPNLKDAGDGSNALRH
ncbi:MAG: sulfatase-like hydrolase/transferase, partial [Planctomycetota bacterium]